MMELRPATLEDADFLFALRTDPETAKNSLQAPPSKERHRRWLDERLKDSGTKLYIAEVGGEAVGTGRLDCRAHSVWLSLTVAARHRGKRYAEQIIEALVAEAKKINAPQVRAIVKGENVTSLKAFLAAGFRSAYLVEVIREP
jgi:RimJ/RimL family protein N-acetyltransferase